MLPKRAAPASEGRPESPTQGVNVLAVAVEAGYSALFLRIDDALARCAASNLGATMAT